MSNFHSKIWPVVIVGGGVVGCAIARRFALCGVSVLLLEKGKDILSGASKANSALLHTAYDAKHNTLELHCIQRGRREYLSIMDDLNLPMLETGAVLTAELPEQMDKLVEIQDSAHRNGVEATKLLNKKQLKQRMPAIHSKFIGGLLIEGENVIDPWSTPLAYITQAVRNGATVKCSCEVQEGILQNGNWILKTSDGEIRAITVINASGIYGDQVEQIRATPKFKIKPRKGQFIVFDKTASSLIKTILLQIPTPKTKGVVIAPTIFGNVIVGPTAEEQENREDTSVSQETLHQLLEYTHQTVPALARHSITASYAGIRPATENSDYQIDCYPNEQWISVSGIRSSGLTSALGIAQYVANLYEKNFSRMKSPDNILSATVPNLAEHCTRPYQAGGHGEIVCHCERVTRVEIENAISSPVPAQDISGLKRRTRCLMGRCQGFYCSWRIWQLTANKIHWPKNLQLDVNDV